LFGADLFPLPQLGVFRTFLVLGVVFLIAVVVGAQLLRNPPPGYVPAGWQPLTGGSAASSGVEMGPRLMLSTPAFWILWITYLAGCAAGLQVIMKASPIWQSFRLAELPPPVPAEEFARINSAGAMAVSMLAIFNSLGRIFWGKMSDVIGRRRTLMAMFLICAAAMLALDRFRVFSLYLLGVCTVGFCFGGYLALYPAVTADFFGTKHLGVNYGWMFTAYGVGGLLGPFLAARLMSVAGRVPYITADGSQKVFEVANYRPAFLVAGFTCLVAAGLIAALKRPAPPPTS